MRLAFFGQNDGYAVPYVAVSRCFFIDIQNILNPNVAVITVFMSPILLFEDCDRAVVNSKEELGDTGSWKKMLFSCVKSVSEHIESG